MNIRFVINTEPKSRVLSYMCIIHSQHMDNILLRTDMLVSSVYEKNTRIRCHWIIYELSLNYFAMVCYNLLIYNSIYVNS